MNIEMRRFLRKLKSEQDIDAGLKLFRGKIVSDTNASDLIMPEGYNIVGNNIYKGNKVIGNFEYVDYDNENNIDLSNLDKDIFDDEEEVKEEENIEEDEEEIDKKISNARPKLRNFFFGLTHGITKYFSKLSKKNEINLENISDIKNNEVKEEKKEEKTEEKPKVMEEEKQDKEKITDELSNIENLLDKAEKYSDKVKDFAKYENQIKEYRKEFFTLYSIFADGKNVDLNRINMLKINLTNLNNKLENESNYKVDEVEDFRKTSKEVKNKLNNEDVKNNKEINDDYKNIMSNFIMKTTGSSKEEAKDIMENNKKVEIDEKLPEDMLKLILKDTNSKLVNLNKKIDEFVNSINSNKEISDIFKDNNKKEENEEKEVKEVKEVKEEVKPEVKEDKKEIIPFTPEIKKDEVDEVKEVKKEEVKEVKEENKENIIDEETINYIYNKCNMNEVEEKMNKLTEKLAVKKFMLQTLINENASSEEINKAKNKINKLSSKIKTYDLMIKTYVETYEKKKEEEERRNKIQRLEEEKRILERERKEKEKEMNEYWKNVNDDELSVLNKYSDDEINEFYKQDKITRDLLLKMAR